MGASVLLLHRLPDGTSHYDWMIQPRPGAALITFRVWERIDRPEVAQFRAERIGDHRPDYLTFEGQISGGRGTAERVCRGEFEVRSEGDHRVDVTGAWEGRIAQRWMGVRDEAGWEFAALAARDAGNA